MTPFTPQAVPASSWKRWLREALVLCYRTLWAQFTLTAILLAVAWSIREFASILLFDLFGPSVVACYVLASASGDRRLNLRKNRDLLGRGFLALMVISAFYWVIRWAFFLIAAFVYISLLHLQSHSAILDQDAIAAPARFQQMCAMLIGLLGLWIIFPNVLFSIPLMVVAHIKLWQALSLTRKAMLLNGHINLVCTVVCAVVGLVCTFFDDYLGMFSLILYPITGAVCYVAYRHIYFGLPPIKQTERAELPAAVPNPA